VDCRIGDDSATAGVGAAMVSVTRLASADDRAQLAVESQEVKNETTPGNLLTTRLIGSMIQDWRE